jgi:hypothetical protein
MSGSLLQLRTRIRISIMTAFFALAGATAARADRRDFIRAYQYATQPQGNLEFELWNDVDAPKSGGFDQAVLTHRLELEYGLTDHWDMALYHVFASAPGEPFHFDSWRLETRYRLAEKGQWPVDVMLYLEAERPGDFTEPWEMEEKLILGKEIGRIELVANFVGEQKLFSGKGYLWEIDAGARYEFTPALHVGGEFWTIQETAGGETASSYYAGPSISWASSKLWVQIGAGFGIGDSSGATFVRSVLGFNL